MGRQCNTNARRRNTCNFGRICQSQRQLAIHRHRWNMNTKTCPKRNKVRGSRLESCCSPSPIGFESQSVHPSAWRENSALSFIWLRGQILTFAAMSPRTFLSSGDCNGIVRGKKSHLEVLLRIKISRWHVYDVPFKPKPYLTSTCSHRKFNWNLTNIVHIPLEMVSQRQKSLFRWLTNHKSWSMFVRGATLTQE